MHRDDADKGFEQLEHWLGDSPGAPWNEYITEHVAKGVLHQFSPIAWQQLADVLLSKPEYWQQRCATALGEAPTAPCIALLKRLLAQSPYLDVRVLAIYHLDWCETPIEQQYRSCIQEVIASLPAAEVEPELTRLLAKAEAGAH
jgi:hypothetical protein